MQLEGGRLAIFGKQITGQERGLADLVFVKNASLAVDGENLWKSFSQTKWMGARREVISSHALQGIDLQVRRREILGILGPNGSGKSTLIRLMATLLIPDQGRLQVFGLDVVRERHQVRRLINRVSVEASFFKKLTARENLAYAAGLYGVSNVQAQAEATRILASLGLPRDKLEIPLESLSRGQQQKIAIARDLLTSPTLMLLDEPTTGLDPTSRRDVQEFILDVRERHDSTIVLCTHDMAEAERLCDRIAIIDQGRIVATASPEDLISGYGQGGSLEDAFFRLTGLNQKSLEEDPR